MQAIDTLLEKFIDELDYQNAKKMFLQISSGKKLRSKLILKIASIGNSGEFASSDSAKTAASPSLSANEAAAPSQTAAAHKEQITTLCAVVELIHLASLLHDDVIDEAKLRRQKPSIYALHGAKNAIMLGDILYSKGFYELSKFEPQIAGIIASSVTQLSIGEMMDVELGEAFNENSDKYLKMIYLKTAVLIEAAAKSAALLNPATADHASQFAQYGKNLGLAFQIIDDILDITADSATLGKPAMSDFKEGKTTLPYMLLNDAFLKNNATSDSAKLKNLFKKELDAAELEWLKSSFAKYNIIAQTHQIAHDYGKKAISSIAAFNNGDLEEIVSNMINRDF